MAWYTRTMPPHKREQVLSAIRDKVVSDQVLYIGKQAKIKLPKSKIYICIGKFTMHFPLSFLLPTATESILTSMHKENKS